MVKDASKGVPTIKNLKSKATCHEKFHNNFFPDFNMILILIAESLHTSGKILQKQKYFLDAATAFQRKINLN